MELTIVSSIFMCILSTEKQNNIKQERIMEKEIYNIEKLGTYCSEQVGTYWYNTADTFTKGKLKNFFKKLELTGVIKYVDNFNETISQKHWNSEKDYNNFIYIENNEVYYYRINKLILNPHYFG